uniref:Uncharacterized protein n=1 Tax=Amphimedon queenslandica TaxID=400682 RepID=A0A1X7SPI1_AMPQE
MLDCFRDTMITGIPGNHSLFLLRKASKLTSSAIQAEYSHPLAIPVFLNFAFRSQGACPSIAMKTEVYSAESYE